MRRGSALARTNKAGSSAARRRPRLAVSPLVLLLLGCQPYTTRPSFGPLPTAAEAFVDEGVSRTTTLLSEGLVAESIPVIRVEPKDGYLETGWFNPFTGAATDARPLGDSVVRVRAWVNAYGENRSSIHAETALRTLANPSLPPRELDQQAPADNPAAVRVASVLAALATRYPVPGATPPGPPALDSLKQAPKGNAASPSTPIIKKPRRDSTPPAPTPNP